MINFVENKSRSCTRLRTVMNVDEIIEEQVEGDESLSDATTVDDREDEYWKTPVVADLTQSTIEVRSNSGDQMMLSDASSETTSTEDKHSTRKRRRITRIHYKVSKDLFAKKNKKKQKVPPPSPPKPSPSVNDLVSVEFQYGKKKKRALFDGIIRHVDHTRERVYIDFFDRDSGFFNFDEVQYGKSRRVLRRVKKLPNTWPSLFF